MAVNLTALAVENAFRWNRAIALRNASAIAKNLVEAKASYQKVEVRTKVPWAIIAVIHERESGQSWSRSLAQGDPWNKKSTHVPVGRGPFTSWEEAAVDALMNCGPFAGKWKDWSIGGALTLLEQYNGLGYALGPSMKKDGLVIARYHPQPSPYVWGGTDQYKSGKYIADGVFRPDVVDQQLGCAIMLMDMMRLDPTISFPGATKPERPPEVMVEVPRGQPAQTERPADSMWATIMNLFKRDA